LLVLADHVHLAAILRTNPRGGVRISLGPAPNNGVVLRHPGVSKFHAWLEPIEEGSVQIVEPGSSNGTWVNDVRLQRRVHVEARSRDRIQFCSVKAVLWSLHALWVSQHGD